MSSVLNVKYNQDQNDGLNVCLVIFKQSLKFDAIIVNVQHILNIYIYFKVLCCREKLNV